MKHSALFLVVVTFLLLSEANCSTVCLFQVRLGKGGRCCPVQEGQLLF